MAASSRSAAAPRDRAPRGRARPRERSGDRAPRRRTGRCRGSARTSYEEALISGCGDRAVADDRLALHQHGGLPGRGAKELLPQLDLERVVATASGAADAGRQGVRVVAEPDLVDASAVAVQDGVANPHVARL